MSKKRTKLELNNFYDIYAGKKHTSYVFDHNKERKSYKALKFGTTKNKDMLEIKPIDGKKLRYVHKRPFEGKRKDFGNKKLLGLKIHSSDNETLESIKKKKPHLTARLKRDLK